MSRHPVVLLLPGLFLVVALAGCGGIGGSGLAPDMCIRVHDGGCVEPEKFNEAAAAAAEKSREHPGFQSQWGLTHINADEAYGNLSVLMGPDVEPGAGVTIGVLDTGVDLEHPSIAGNGNRKVTEIFTPGAVEETLADEGLLSHGTAVASVAAGARTDAVVALNPVDGRIASFSNRCGIAADFCIAAPGEQVRSAYFGNVVPSFASRDYVNLRGTSFAAPMVSGGLALMKQLFRDQLSNTDLVARLFETADRSGFYADSAIYGRGSMDLGAATSPVGALEVPVGASVGENGVRLLSTGLSPGTALGDGLQRSLASREIMALDALGAPFWHRLGSFTAAAQGPSVTARLRGFLVPERDGTAEGRETAPVSLHAALLKATAEVRGSHMSLAEGAVKATLAGQGGLTAAAFTTKGIRRQTPAVGASLGWRRPGSPLGLRAGWIGERETLLGSVGEGAFGTLAGDTSFVGVDAHTDQGGWRVGANAELGLVSPAARGGLVTRVSSLATSAFALHATRPLGGAGTLRLSLSQPLRVENGRASLTVPSGRTKQGMVLYSPVRADLAPSGRQVDIAGQWRRPLAEGELRLGTVLSLRPGHRQAADPEMTLLAGWRLDF